MPQPVLHQPTMDGSGDHPPSASAAAEQAAAPPPKKKSKPSSSTTTSVPTKKIKKPKKRKDTDASTGNGPPKKARTSKPKRQTHGGGHHHPHGLTPAQEAAQEQMRKALEEDKYSAIGSIVEDTDDDEDTMEDVETTYRGRPVRMDKAALQQAMRKHQLYERLGVLPSSSKGTAYAEEEDDDDDDEDRKPEAIPGTGDDASLTSKRSKPKKKKKRKPEAKPVVVAATTNNPLSLLAADDHDADMMDRDASSIFGATQGSSSNSIWVECDKCKKWRRLRGAVDEKKLPPKWYCSMNKNDPERARCSAPEEDYDTPHTAESVADARTRKHLRVWVRRLKGNEDFEARQPTLTRGKKRAAVAATQKDAYEWVRCCNPSCGKWRAVLRFMDAKTHVVDRTNSAGEWYCVMNNWDEKVASCAAPQENLPAAGCPPWVLQDE